MTLSFTVPGPPVPKGRPRKGRNGRMYTPAKTRRYEMSVRIHAVEAMAKQGWPRGYGGPCALTIRLFVPDNRRRDVDNMAKAAADAINEFVYADDSQIVEMRISKSVDRERPRCEIEVRMVE